MAESFTGCCCDCYIGITHPNQSELLAFDTDKTKNFYRIFADTIFQIIVKHNGLVRRRIGDGFEFYFPRTSDTNDLTAFIEMLECCIILIQKQQDISNEMKLNNMPPISYKVTADYESVNLAGDNLWNKPLQAAYKIFTLTDLGTNILVITENLRSTLIKSPESSRYQFNSLGKISIANEKPNYGVYSVTRKLTTL